MKKILPILLVCVLLLSACGSDNSTSSSVVDKSTNQTSENNPTKDWEQNPTSDFDYRYDDELQGVVVSYKGESETVWFPTEVNGDYVVAIEEMQSPKVVKEVYIPEGIKVIGWGAFEKCVNLKSVIIPEGVVDIGHKAFSGCKNLESISLPDSVVHIGDDAFRDVPATNMALPKSLEVIGRYAFVDNSEITSIILPSSLKKIGQSAFASCDKLAEITLADPDALLDVNLYAFADTYWYNKRPDGFISLGNNLVAYKGEIAGTKLVIPDGTKTIAEGIVDRPYIDTITEIVLPEGLKRIGESAFNFAFSLITVNIPDSVEYIGSAAFGRSDSVDEATKEQIRQINPGAIPSAWE